MGIGHFFRPYRTFHFTGGGSHPPVTGFGDCPPLFPRDVLRGGIFRSPSFVERGGTILFLSDLAAHGIDKGLGRWEKASSSVVAVEVVTQRPNAGILGIKPGGGGTQFQAEVSAGGEKPFERAPCGRERREHRNSFWIQTVFPRMIVGFL